VRENVMGFSDLRISETEKLIKILEYLVHNYHLLDKKYFGIINQYAIMMGTNIPQPTIMRIMQKVENSGLIVTLHLKKPHKRQYTIHIIQLQGCLYLYKSKLESLKNTKNHTDYEKKKIDRTCKKIIETVIRIMNLEHPDFYLLYLSFLLLFGEKNVHNALKDAITKTVYEISFDFQWKPSYKERVINKMRGHFDSFFVKNVFKGDFTILGEKLREQHFKHMLDKNDNCAKLVSTLKKVLKKHEAEMNYHKTLTDYYNEMLKALRSEFPECFTT
jgi:hypothetical protein